MDWLEVFSEADFLLDRLGIEICRRSCVDRSTFLGDVDVHDFLCFNVVDWAKVERVGVLQVIHVWPVVHQSLLEARAVCEAFIVTVMAVSGSVGRLILLLQHVPNRPRITVNFMHIFWWYTNNPALFDYLWIFSDYVLDDLEVLHSDL